MYAVQIAEKRGKRPNDILVQYFQYPSANQSKGWTFASHTCHTSHK